MIEKRLDNDSPTPFSIVTTAGQPSRRRQEWRTCPAANYNLTIPLHRRASGATSLCRGFKNKTRRNILRNFGSGKYTMRRTSLNRALCPIARSLDEIGDWWTLLIVRDAFHGARRFGEFQRGLGLAKNILSVRLQKMVADGIMELRPASDGGAHNEYHLTEKGLRLRIILVALRQWGEDHLYKGGEPTTVLVDKTHGWPIKRLSLTAQNGEPLNPLDVEVRKGIASSKKSSRTIKKLRH